MNSVKPAPALKYPGAKWNLADWIISYMPEHETYLEPFFGSGAVFFRKPHARLETINDLDVDVMNLFRVIRDRPAELAALVELTPWAREELAGSIGYWDNKDLDDVERARKLLVWTWQQIGRRTDSAAINGWRWTKDASSNPVPAWRGLPDRIFAGAKRLLDAQIETRPAIEVITAQARNDVLIYADPPYIRSTRSRNMYRNEMSDDAHSELLSALLQHPGPVLLSGYGHSMYEELESISGWVAVRKAARAECAQAREEVLWISPAATEALGGRLF